MNRYVISDLHLGHEWILQHRPEFKSLDHMHNTIITNWNNTVSESDTVYVLGDVVWKKKYIDLLKDLKGRLILIKGNHDIFNLKDYSRFDDIRAVHQIDVDDKKYVLTHVPVHTSQMFPEGRWMKNIHGHLHRIIINDSRYINVCVENTNYSPLLIKNII